MRSSNPVISFLTPTYSNPQLLLRALDSLLKQDCPNWEMVVSPDDGGDYSALLTMDDRIRLVDAKGANQTGPGPARNRALACATGEFVTCLDDDDTVAENFVAKCLESLQRSSTVLVPSVYVTPDLKPVRTVAMEIGELDISGFAELYATAHVVEPRHRVRPWTDHFAEDVLHTSVAIENNGGKMKVVADTRYQITLREGSLCATLPDIANAYQRLIDRIDNASLLSDLSEASRKNIRNLLCKRLAMHQLYEMRPDFDLGYQDFVQLQLNAMA
jgi:glycosyltransferase involved in cell wall biosynthesis